MTTEEKKLRIAELKKKADSLRKEVYYYSASEQSLKLCLNGSYGALASPYFVMFANEVAGSTTAMGRDLIQTMDKVNQDYWYNQWHLDFELHSKLGIKDVTKINEKENVSIYCDTDSLFVSFKPGIDHCTWKNLIFNKQYLETIDKPFIILGKSIPKFNNPNCLASVKNIDELKENLDKPYELLLFDGLFIKDRNLNEIKFEKEILWNWTKELDFIQGIDNFRYGWYFKKCLDEYAEKFNVVNREDFELEKISESIINIAKKKYIQHIVHEDGQDFDPMTYIFPKGVELIRSSTPLFAREKIVAIVKYLFSHPDDFNVKDLLKLVKGLRKEFELADIDDISMQSSCSNYDEKVIDDKNLPLKHANGAHFAVKAASYYNYLLQKDKNMIQKYESIKSGTKIKYYYCKDKRINDIFAYIRGSYPIEMAPEIDYTTQFAKAILSPINSIIAPLGMPEITERLTVVMDIFGGF